MNAAGQFASLIWLNIWISPILR